MSGVWIWYDVYIIYFIIQFITALNSPKCAENKTTIQLQPKHTHPSRCYDSIHGPVPKRTSEPIKASLPNLEVPYNERATGSKFPRAYVGRIT
ncbi:hypothetical protein L211DRAFT_833015 [Terfezia boudieri ATCC MYA-4762]|uniref:Uncharacterized protein n=1 Tax=Terfezia boudieri ATCC MYA-4762 TaxID=1051890 RepID=A0A3N4M281_9PEZI|nr:hypothetical protein L211DRAFT_833015 [Terfezia boudieri ATCC MYA-4762]